MYLTKVETLRENCEKAFFILYWKRTGRCKFESDRCEWKKNYAWESRGLTFTDLYFCTHLADLHKAREEIDQNITQKGLGEDLR